MMSTHDDGDLYVIKGAHGTIAEQKDEAYYDDRSDADDDMEKSRIKFPNNTLYGRERELEALQNIYNSILSTTDEKRSNELVSVSEEKEDEVYFKDQELAVPDPCESSRVVFLSGYSGIGKSTLVKEFVKQIQNKYKSSDGDKSSILHASGKYTEQSTASAPFSAISDVLERLATIIREDEHGKGVLYSDVVHKISESELIGPGTDGGRVLRATFTPLGSLLESAENASKRGGAEDGLDVHHSMNAIKECTHEILSIMCEGAEHPLVLFLDDLQWGDGASIEMLTFLLSSKKLKNIMFILAYRSNEVDADHSFTKLMENVTGARNENIKLVDQLDLFSLSAEAITRFIADSVKKEEDEGVAELAEVVYGKTMGNIFFVMQAVEELVRKNIIFYDVMCFEWRWVVSKVDLANYMSDDVVETVKGKIKELSAGIQHLLIVMAYIPNTLDVPMLRELMNHGEILFEESQIRGLLKEASDEGMLFLSVQTKNYMIAHDRIRQASLEFAGEKGHNELVLHISQVLQDFASGPEMEWCLYVAVDLLNSLPPDKTNQTDLIKLNIRVSKTAKSRGSMGKENELLHKALQCLEASGVAWKEYALTLKLFNSMIFSDFSVGSFDKAGVACEEVLKNAKTTTDKFQAYLHRMLIAVEESSDHVKGAEDGVRILNMYGFDIPDKISKAYMVKEEIKLKVALRNRSYSQLIKLPVQDEPIYNIFVMVQLYAVYTANDKLVKVLAWKAIQHAIMQGMMGCRLSSIIAMLAVLLVKQGKAKDAQELGNVAVALAEQIRDDIETRATTRHFVYGSVLPQVQSFYSTVDPLLQSHKDVKLVGANVAIVTASLFAHFQAYFAAGLELGPLIESRLLMAEELYQGVGFLTTFKILRQLSMNLRTRTAKPTEFQGEAFKEEEVLSGMNANARKMALRDSSSSRLQLAFIFWNEDVMVKMLNILGDYPPTDMAIARLHNRLCFAGLAAFALGKKKGSESFVKLGQDCLNHFKNLTKHGSANAKPVYLFMLAMKVPCRENFFKAIDACAEARMVHLEAMALERYASYLRNEKDTTLANDCITSSYWLYQDWGAHAKALQLSEQYVFLKDVKRKKAKSAALSTAKSEISPMAAATYSFNSTFKSRKTIL